MRSPKPADKSLEEIFPMFTWLAFFVLAFILLRISRVPDFAAGIPFSLFFFLYVGLLCYGFLWAGAPAWLRAFTLAVFFAGALWLIAETIWAGWKRMRQNGNYLGGLRKKQGALHELVMAGHLLSHAKLGALILLERKQSLAAWCEKGIRVNATLSRELLFSIFTPPGALHDGAVIVRRGSVATCGVIVPLSKNPDMPKELGTRHRAAVGFSEVSDALCLVISEETGSISLADRGSLYYDIPFEKLPDLLEAALRFKLQRKKSLMLSLEPQPV